MISEIHDQLPQKPDAIFCSVGGGGLLGGIIVGCKNVGWDDGRRSGFCHWLRNSMTGYDSTYYRSRDSRR